MGLETVEIILDTEERFGIEIPDDEASQVRTVGEFYDLVLRKLAVPSAASCLTAMAFYRLRRAFVEVMGIDRRQFHPQRPWRDLVPVRQTRRIWPALAAACGLRMPPLIRPDSLTIALVWAGIAVFVGGLALSVLKIIPLWQSWVCGGAAIALGVVMMRPLAVHPERTGETIGDLARAVYDVNAGEMTRAAGETNRHDVWQSLQMLISVELGVPAEEITPSCRFVEDLNCG